MSDNVEYGPKFAEMSTRGADVFSTLWLAATEQAVNAFREAGLGDVIESDYRYRYAISRALYNSLAVATRFPRTMLEAAPLFAAKGRTNQ